MARRYEVIIYDCARTYPELSAPRLLASLSTSERAKFAAIVEAVATAPPRNFAGGGYWEALRGDLAGLHEIRFKGKDRWHLRFFCLLEEQWLPPQLIVLAASKKRPGTLLPPSHYAKVRDLADAFTRASSRPID
jgi:hypothetical protein